MATLTPILIVDLEYFLNRGSLLMKKMHMTNIVITTHFDFTAMLKEENNNANSKRCIIAIYSCALHIESKK